MFKLFWLSSIVWGLPLNKFHSEILASLNFNKNFFFLPWIGEQPYTKMLFWQFSNMIIDVKIVGKIPDQHLNVWLSPNPGDKVQKRWRTKGKICPVLSTRILTLSPWLENNRTFKCGSGIFPTNDDDIFDQMYTFVLYRKIQEEEKTFDQMFSIGCH